MSVYEYRVIAAPVKGVKAKGRKTPEDRFSHALELTINEMARDRWEYLRAEALPSTERSGLTSTKTVWHNLLVFRRKTEAEATQDTPALPAPAKDVLADDDTGGTRKTPPLTATKTAPTPSDPAGVEAPADATPDKATDEAPKSEATSGDAAGTTKP